MGVPVPGTFESGMYHCLLTSSQTGILITRRKHPTGTHEVFWKILIEYLDTLTEQILVGHLAPVDAKDVFTKFGELRAVMKANGASGGSWLSMVRNEVQYRHQYGVWHPCNVKKHRREAIGRIAAQWKRDPMDVDLAIARPGELETFAGACAFIVALSRALLARIAERSFIGGRSFARASFA
jgi:hypothetical protein